VVPPGCRHEAGDVVGVLGAVSEGRVEGPAGSVLLVERDPWRTAVTSSSRLCVSVAPRSCRGRSWGDEILGNRVPLPALCPGVLTCASSDIAAPAMIPSRRFFPRTSTCSTPRRLWSSARTSSSAWCRALTRSSWTSSASLLPLPLPIPIPLPQPSTLDLIASKCICVCVASPSCVVELPADVACSCRLPPAAGARVASTSPPCSVTARLWCCAAAARRCCASPPAGVLA
jgi:hypothetical protein